MSRRPDLPGIAARLRVKDLSGDSVLTAVWVALHVPAALLLGHLLTDHATATAAAPPPGPATMAGDTAPPE
ncbi:hypothetical protein [Streptomyces sp. GC420]|uniref:hypothetical protein n=1 Tax=Streptomyces sp. GC420 TaxID=2697568 RepID=UPI0014151F18|nr:hypothetical protein [Streptomyces sp. GC420]NBM14683.1 hypothetical protein [Streptomyces sp. GC420]